MHDDLLTLIERKLKEAFRSADEKALGHIRDKWSGIGPAPSCPSLDQMMKELNELIIER